MKPTKELYTYLQNAYDFFNKVLFHNELPQCLITLQRKRGARGYYSPERFYSMLDGERKTDEIALNPTLFDDAMGDIRPISTLVHEMCHLWQEHYGKPSRNNYHNKQWARKMEAVGLIPSNTGKLGGKKTGQSMTHYIEKGGRFEEAFNRFAKNKSLQWADYPRHLLAKEQPKSKQKFTCPDCEQNAWAKPTALLLCGDCSTEGDLVEMIES